MARGLVLMLCAAALLSGCELVADFDRSKLTQDAAVSGGDGDGDGDGDIDAAVPDAAVDQDASDDDAG